MSSSMWTSLEDLQVWEERRGMDYVLMFQEKLNRFNKELTPEDAYILGDTLIAWALKMREDGWKDTIEIVYEITGKKYIRKKKT